MTDGTLFGKTEEPENFHHEDGYPSQLIYYTADEADELIHTALMELENAKTAWESVREDAGQPLSGGSGVFIVPAVNQRIVDAVAREYTSAVSDWVSAVSKFDSALYAGAEFIGVYEFVMPYSEAAQERAKSVRALVRERLAASDNKRRAEAAKVRTWFEGQRALGSGYTPPPWLPDMKNQSREDFLLRVEEILSIPVEEFLPRDLDGNIQR